MTTVAGIILCGGRSQRMGQSKALLPLGGEAMLSRVVQTVCGAAEPVCVVAAPDQQLPPLPAAVEVVHDSQPFPGPLAGLGLGLRIMQDRADMAFVCSCDLPLLLPALIRYLASLLEENDVVLPHVQGYPQPLCAVYRTSLWSMAEVLIQQGTTRVLSLADQARTRIMTESELWPVDLNLHSFRNINTPEEYERLQKELRASEQVFP